MLTEIRIEALGAISAATAEFGRGLTVLTGETGTGKTMVVTSLHLLGGARADASRVRSGSARAVVEGRFTTTELGDGVSDRVDGILEASGADRDDDGSVIAARSVSKDGPSRAYLGGRSVPAKSLATFTTELLALHGQNDQLRLMRPDEQRGALDRYVDVTGLLAKYRKLRDEWLTARRDLIDRRQRARDLALEADRLQFGLGEIDAVAPEAGEDDALVADIRRLSELDALRDAAQTARAALSGELGDGPQDDVTSALDAAAQAKSVLSATDDSALRALGDRLTEVIAVIGDVSGELGDYLSELPSDASTLESKLARQAELRNLTRKYAADIDGVLQWAADARQRLSLLDVSEEALAGLQKNVDELHDKVVLAAAEVTKARTKASKSLAKAVTSELAGLAMGGAGFSIAVSPLEARADDSAPLTLPDGTAVHAGHDGVDAVEFGFTPHSGSDVLPLAKSASGGELSRVMLALEVVLSASAEGTTMVFDEVDAGVGGRAAVQIGKRLARLARTHQVIVVTHLPQVAAYGDVHLVVESGPKSSRVVRLEDDDRVAELARMLAGLGDTDSGRAHARELLAAAQQEHAAT
ncbi:DNA repair protein RecN [Mycobacterium sp. CBMA293]|uniref:DNA repair protein RecN n=1 Tax=unclassified Mycolicibacterium TaxID=2636767 RepID=UPI0012DDBE6A|nr:MULTISPECIES: DNA repair protein RecN [unclassified Mycolicibacterium]MUL48814.1 DNA repair protein RecN [Mycolicibacterium sp. CBMA 360]MUL62270.1 DNA repair protein RecN [Mycolicibacterium sp. CBMA 335]MUL71730.1 DNA repair protein RecN [Mycolicibacterium sp. CBMA 311]MUL93685.1 DNA repair protein RecN [Mycolicibacterium sp. CBMA 230]MUM09371.1 DNA repair protein RecN [Mycolicibacterium sp. CBMA 213]